jgi:hypothetical protein
MLSQGRYTQGSMLSGRGGVMSIRQSYSRRAPLVVLLGTSLVSLGAWPVMAGETASVSSKAVAAVPMSRLGARLPRASLADVDLNVLWAQYRPANTVPAEPDEQENNDSILVAFPIGSSESANQEIANEYNLELVDSRELSALGLRLVRYRVRDSRPAAGVVASLLRDARVERAQLSATYRMPAPPADVASGAPAEPRPANKARPAERVKGAVGVAQAPKSAQPPRVVSQVVAQQPSEARLDAGDILSGGL